MKRENIFVAIEPGVCGFCCEVRAWQQNKHSAIIEITNSECELVQRLAENITEVTLQDIFTPQTKNPVFQAAEQAGCHLTCPVPVAVLKAAEVALELALPRKVRISFKQAEKKDTK
jgi:hypothetical protein